MLRYIPLTTTTKQTEQNEVRNKLFAHFSLWFNFGDNLHAAGGLGEYKRNH